MRLQGTPIVKHVLDQGMSFCLFDFHGNGLSNGKYVTFGWTETLDLDAVLTMLIGKMKVRSVILWGRSMGAATAILYLSERFRDIVYKFFKYKKKILDLGFVDQQYIRGVILDSPFGDMRVNVTNFVQAKAAKVPAILVEMALAVIDTKVKEKTGVLLTEIKPICYLDGLTVPTMLMCGDKDELIKLEEIKSMFE
jgi:pimeloyl-ACP methyl ester carboxylesterase